MHDQVRALLPSWSPEVLRDFGKVPLMLEHQFHEHKLFSDASLARVLGDLGRFDYYVNTMDLTTHDPRTRREGEIKDLSGKDVLEAVRRGRIWILVLRPHEMHQAYRDFLESIYEEIARIRPGFKTSFRKMSLLISSPRIQVYYHCDIPGQTLWQVRGQKRVIVYPNRPPFLPQAALERIVMGEAHEISLDYDPAFDSEAQVFDLKPGQMLHWPLNAPHRVINGDCVNVSFTTEHFTSFDRRHYHVNLANGILRSRFGMKELSRNITGPAYWAKFGLSSAWRMTGLQRRLARSVKAQFVVDPGADGGYRDLHVAAAGQ